MNFLRKKRWWWVIAVILVVFICYERRPVDRLYAFLPSNIVGAVEVRRTTGSWAEAAANPVSQRALSYLPKELSGVLSITDNKLARWALSGLAPRYAVFACLPGDEVNQEPVWIAAGWLGWRGYMARLVLNVMTFEKLKEERNSSGDTYWVFHDARLPPGIKVAFTISDGVLLSCLTSREHALEEIVASGQTADDAVVRVAQEADGPVTVWMDVDFISPEASALVPEIVMEITSMNSTSLAGRISTSSRLIEQDSVYNELNIPLINALLSDNALGMFAAQMNALSVGIRLAMGDAGARAFNELFVEYGAHALVGIFIDTNAAKSSRAAFHPPWIIAVKSRAASKIIDDFPNFLALLYHEFGFPWLLHVFDGETVTTRSLAEGHTYCFIGDDASNGITSAEHDNWVLLSSDGNLLKERLGRVGSTEQNARASWSEGMLSQSASPFYVWINKEMGENAWGSGGVEAAGVIASILPWLNALRIMGESHLWVASPNAQTVIPFHVGH